MSDLSVFRKYSYFEKNTKVDGILKEKIPQEFLVGICNSNVGNYSFAGPTVQGASGSIYHHQDYGRSVNPILRIQSFLIRYNV